MVLVVKNPPTNAGNIRDKGSVPGLGKSSGGGHGNPLQYSCLENRMDGGAWWATVHGVEKSLTRLKQLSMHAPCFDTDLCCSPCSFLLKQWKHWWMMLETPSLHLIQTAVPFVTVHSPPDVKSRLTGKDLHAGKD